MANADIMVAGTEDIPVLAKLYSEVFRPPHDEQFFRRRFMGRHNVLVLLAAVDRRPIGFTIGFELKPTTFFCWMSGVAPDMRRQGIGRQLMEALHAWAVEHGYAHVRLECHNAQRPVMQMAIAMEYDVIGLRWESELNENVVVFEKTLGEES